MANALEIKSVAIESENNIRLEFSGYSASTVTFRVAPYPDALVTGEYEDVNGTSAGGNVRIIGMPFQGLWYIWLVNADGVSANPACVFTVGADTPLVGISKHIASLLEVNRLAIDAFYKAVIPTGEVKQIVCGNPSSINRYPSILVVPASKASQWEVAPATFLSNFNVRIECLCLKEDASQGINIASSLGEGVQYILSRRRYLNFSVGENCFYDAHVSSIAVEDREIKDGKLLSVATLTWSASALESMNTGEFNL